MKTEPDLRWDFALSAFASILAAYSAGMAISNVESGFLFVLLIVAGSVFSATVQRLFSGKRLLNVGALFYTAIAVAVLQMGPTLNGYLPGEGFPREALAGPMCWMLAFGSFVAWTESVLLFQAVPAIAVFGIVGVWDTFSGTPFAFFGFLICSAALMFRSHRRDMLKQAKESGFPALSEINKGPWKWMAGPQWALTSAALIVLVSLIGAPVIQSSMSSVAGTVKVQLPAGLARIGAQPESLDNRQRSSLRVGTGPIHPGNLAVLAIRMDQPRYLRDSAFDRYTGQGWERSYLSPLPGDRVWQDGRTVRRTSFAQQILKNPVRLRFSIEVLNGVFDVLPAPGEVTKIELPSRFGQRGDTIPRMEPGAAIYEGEALVPGNQAMPTEAYRNLPEPYLPQFTDPGPSEKVVALARRIASGEKTDYEKAVAIRNAISDIAKYNLGAPAVPADTDAVEYFLFHSKEGYCDLFASSMVLMARAVGIPARYASGYYPIHDERDKSGRIILHASERHAWAELFFKDFGWVPFDATSGAVDVEGYGRGSNGEGPGFFSGPIRDAALNAGAMLAFCSAALFFWRGKRTGNVRPRAKDRGATARAAMAHAVARSKMAKLYMGLTADIQRLSGVRRDAALTPLEYIGLVRGSLAGSHDQVAAVTDSFVESLYSRRPVATDDVAAFAAGVRDARRAVRSLFKPLWITVPAWAFAQARNARDWGRAIMRMRREDRLA